MKIVRNSVIPFEGFKAVTIFPFIFWVAVFIAWLGHKFYNNMKK